MRVVVHGGFHKTGTTTVQKALRANKPRLKRHLRIFLRPGMIAACEAARAYSQHRDAMNLALFGYEVAQIAETWAPDDPRPVLLASEDLAGHMPGRRGLRRYDATPKLMAVLAETLRAVHPSADIRFYFSTRAATPWLHSCHAQHVRATRMTLDRDTYADAFAGSGDLDKVVADVATATGCPVSATALEVSAPRPLGPLAPLLDCFDLPARVIARIAPHPAANTAFDPDLLAQMLDINRSARSDADCRAAKDVIKRRGR